MPPLRALLLDFGGTLDSDGVHWSTIYAGAFAQAGLPLDRQILDRAFLDSERLLDRLPEIAGFGLEQHVRWQVQQMLRQLCACSALRVQDSTPDGQSSTADAEAITALVLKPVRQQLSHSRDLLAQQRPRFRLGLISNFTENLHLILQETGLKELLEVVLCSADQGIKKPDPAIFRLALDRLGLRPGEAAMIGDSLVSDIMPAKALGLKTLWIRGDRVFGQGDEGAADHVVKNLAEALNICAADHDYTLAGGVP